MSLTLSESQNANIIYYTLLSRNLDVVSKCHCVGLLISQIWCHLEKQIYFTSHDS